MIAAVFVSALFAVASAAPRSWDFYGPYTGVSTYAGSGGGYAGPAGAYAGAGFPFYGGGFPFAGFPFGGFPFGGFPFPNMYFGNWYEGKNVCKEEKEEEVKDDFAELRSDPGYQSTSSDKESETCESTNTKAICVKRVTERDGKTMKHTTTYKCCHGFTRDPEGGPGCVENSDGPEVEIMPHSTESVHLSDKSKYSYVQSPKGMDKVPPQ